MKFKKSHKCFSFKVLVLLSEAVEILLERSGPCLAHKREFKKKWHSLPAF